MAQSRNEGSQETRSRNISGPIKFHNTSPPPKKISNQNHSNSSRPHSISIPHNSQQKSSHPRKTTTQKSTQKSNTLNSSFREYKKGSDREILNSGREDLVDKMCSCRPSHPNRKNREKLEESQKIPIKDKPTP